MKKSELKQIIKEEIQGILKENKEFQKIKREVDLMTDPRIQRGWVDFYMNRINGEKLKSYGMKLLSILEN
jgi:methionine synthase II (cobalamin-independent)